MFVRKKLRTHLWARCITAGRICSLSTDIHTTTSTTANDSLESSTSSPPLSDPHVPSTSGLDTQASASSSPHATSEASSRVKLTPTEMERERKRRKYLDDVDPVEPKIPPIFSHHDCSRCERVFSTEKSLDEHLENHDNKFRCNLCNEMFTRRNNLLAHKKWHTAMAKLIDQYAPATQRASVDSALRCRVCGDDFTTLSAVGTHLASLPRKHHAQTFFRETDIKDEDLISAEVFRSHAPVIEQALEHATMLSSKQAITDTRFVNAAKHSSIYVAELAHPEAPECAYFSITPDTEVCSPVVSIFPLNAEPGELTTKLRVDLDLFRRIPNEYKLYFCGATLPQNGKHYSSNNRVVLMFAREEDWERVEKLGFRELNMEDNSILRWDNDSQQWFVVSEMRTDMNRPVQVIVAVANGASVEHGNMQWFETCRVHYDGEGCICPFCGKTETGFKALMDHIVVSHEGKKFPCRKCDAAFISRSYLAEHNLLVHEGLVFRCKECKKEFKSRSGLTWHMKRHSGLVFACHVCGKKYSQKQPLQRHLDSVHYGIRFPCLDPSCDQKFASKSIRKSHMLYTHGEPLSCPKCQKTYTSKSALEIHIRVVHEGRRIPCDECGLTFTTKSYVNAHKKTAHGGERCTCNVCGRQFRQRSSLTRHERIHTAEALRAARDFNEVNQWMENKSKMHG